MKRRIGGLGVFILKNTMDDIAYEYRDGRNILTMMSKPCYYAYEATEELLKGMMAEGTDTEYIQMMYSLYGDYLSTEAILTGVKADVDLFVQGAKQFDDLTMLCLEYRGYGDQN